MRRFLVLVVLLVAVIPLLLSPVALAQETTPEGVTSQAGTVAGGTIEILAPGTASLGLGYITLEPGDSFPFDPNDPSAVLVYMTFGELIFRVDSAMTVARGRGSVDAWTPVPTEPEDVTANTEFTLGEGDSALFPPAISGEVRNDGEEEAEMWVVTVAVLDEEAATPTP